MFALCLAGLLTGALGSLDLHGTEGCLERAELERELRARVPESAAALRLELMRLEADGTSALRIRLEGERGEALLERSLPFVEADCPALPRLVAQVVERRLRALAAPAPDTRGEEPPAPAPGHEAEAARAPALDEEPSARAGPAVVEALPPRAEASAPLTNAPSLRLAVDAGTALGLFPFGGDVRLELEGDFGAEDGPFLGGTGSLRLDAPVAVGEGAALVGTVLIGGVVGLRFPSGLVAVSPFVGGGAGLTFAQGLGFSRTRSPVFPMAAALGGVRLDLPLGLTARLGVELPLVYVSLSQSSAAEPSALPRMRLFASVGARFGGSQ